MVTQQLTASLYLSLGFTEGNLSPSYPSKPEVNKNTKEFFSLAQLGTMERYFLLLLALNFQTNQ